MSKKQVDKKVAKKDEPSKTNAQKIVVSLQRVKTINKAISTSMATRNSLYAKLVIEALASFEISERIGCYVEDVFFAVKTYQDEPSYWAARNIASRWNALEAALNKEFARCDNVPQILT